MSTLQQGEDLAAKGATAPRVSLAGMEARIGSEHYFTAGAALDALDMECVDGALDVLTLCILTLDNGWVLLGKSAPASADNFDAEKGKTFARDDALRQLWTLEGYLLRERLSLEESNDEEA